MGHEVAQTRFVDGSHRPNKTWFCSQKETLSLRAAQMQEMPLGETSNTGILDD